MEGCLGGDGLHVEDEEEFGVTNDHHVFCFGQPGTIY